MKAFFISLVLIGAFFYYTVNTDKEIAIEKVANQFSQYSSMCALYFGSYANPEKNLEIKEGFCFTILQKVTKEKFKVKVNSITDYESLYTNITKDRILRESYDVIRANNDCQNEVKNLDFFIACEGIDGILVSYFGEDNPQYLGYYDSKYYYWFNDNNFRTEYYEINKGVFVSKLRVKRAEITLKLHKNKLLNDFLLYWGISFIVLWIVLRIFA